MKLKDYKLNQVKTVGNFLLQECRLSTDQTLFLCQHPDLCRFFYQTVQSLDHRYEKQGIKIAFHLIQSVLYPLLQ